MGLNESFNQIRGQILLVDHLPYINVVLYMVIQYEKQRDVITTLNPTETPIACVVQTHITNLKKDRPNFAHCGVIGHLKEKCIKLHGYPSGYKKPQSCKAKNVNSNGTAGT
ncbi:unnamed protein product [Vicia faba]|uniref:Uncharacterized protein n=1 Tax=Vicia faba TaxID=3906 RepID=A0AAV1A1T0_VICFA|nr:unnamed protein product [Vicia faba]